MAKRKRERKAREETSERNPEVTSLVANVCITGGFAPELKQKVDKRDGQVSEHVQFTFRDPAKVDSIKQDRSFLVVHDNREATLAAFKALKVVGGQELSVEQQQQLLAAVNQPAHVSIRESGDFDYVVLKPAWNAPRGEFLGYEQLPNQPLKVSQPGERTLWFWRTGQPYRGLTVLKLVETRV